jgi:hypothetical protein
MGPADNATLAGSAGLGKLTRNVWLARNVALSYARWVRPDIVIVIDIHEQWRGNPVRVPVLRRWLEKRDFWDAASFMSGKYYDLFWLRWRANSTHDFSNHGFDFWRGPHKDKLGLGKALKYMNGWLNLAHEAFNTKGATSVAIDSAFNALNIYKGEVYFNGMYSGNAGFTAGYKTTKFHFHLILNK